MDAEETPILAVQKRHLSVGSVKTQRVGNSYRTCEIIEPKKELTNTPSQRITLSINTSSNSKVLGSRPPLAKVVHSDSECIRGNNHMEDKGKRAIEDAAAFPNNKKKKFVIQHNP
ncbi:Hypothetical predicted protein [Olea europaea subsp. europaea]|uniref:Uncharacterized protein n=1 Tax=Olea europaea subsp. europaea TaxID=158383 RepID=A0A8S0RET8_OLEEU|nr:Hypothetical predicted protein [Olea europaea subsp. europaea]